jgi:hypothetical protein
MDLSTASKEVTLSHNTYYYDEGVYGIKDEDFLSISLPQGKAILVAISDITALLTSLRLGILEQCEGLVLLSSLLVVSIMPLHEAILLEQAIKARYDDLLIVEKSFFSSGRAESPAPTETSKVSLGEKE